MPCPPEPARYTLRMISQPSPLPAAPTAPLAPTRAAGLARLAAFLPKAGVAYARHRNSDLPGHPHVSGLSAHIRHRLVTEAEVISAVRDHHNDASADKFMAEVWWRSYWKGWLELHPSVWADYLAQRDTALAVLPKDGAAQATYDAARAGQTGIDGFDDWARELVASGYLHNHARMWFASIWIFTLGLPWPLGADFFLQHLLDGDPASNTLSWRWVAGLHTAGKTYLATPDNIATYTAGRFRPKGLATTARALPMGARPSPRPAPQGDQVDLSQKSALILHDDDLSTGALPAGFVPDDVVFLDTSAARASGPVSPLITQFVRGAMADTATRLGVTCDILDRRALALRVGAWARAGVTQIVAPHAPVGPVAGALRALRPQALAAGLTLVQPLCAHDRTAWPHATGGFFRFREAVMGR